jgi:REP element-mobilizing transposase RayT
VTLNDEQRKRVEDACRKHATIRGWKLYALNARSNHIHLVVAADRPPSVVRDQFKAHATRAIRSGTSELIDGKVWTRGGDIQIIDDEESLEQVILYVTQAQDRMDMDE